MVIILGIVNNTLTRSIYMTAVANETLQHVCLFIKEYYKISNI